MYQGPLLLEYVDEPITDSGPISPELLAAVSGLKSADSLSAVRCSVREIIASLTPSRRTDCTQPSNEVSSNTQFVIRELHQIQDSHTLDRASYYAARLVKALTEKRCSSLNDIDLNRWKAYDDILTDSLWILDRRDNTGVHNAGYWGNFIPQIPNQLIRRFTKPDELVLDTFAGMGTTLIEAQRLGRNSLGVELQRSVADAASHNVSRESSSPSLRTEIVVGDSRTIDYAELLMGMGMAAVQLVIMHPPYHDIIRFSDDSRDLSNAGSVDDFLESMAQCIQNASRVLDRGRYLAIVIGDKYSKGEWIPLGFQVMSTAMKQGYSLKSTIVKNFDQTAAKRTQRELWRYRALAGGFYVFKHEYIFLLRKE